MPKRKGDAMRDGFGRIIHYARLSVTDRCSLRCRYCMPETGGPWLDRLLTDGELLAVCRCLASLGVTRFRVTGGEPLCRPGLAGLIGAVKSIPGVETVSITTNGVELAARLSALLDAGVDGVNLSLDTLDRDRFREITRRDALGNVLAGLHAALDCPGLNLKINCVAAPGREQDWIELASLARERRVAVRFIEPMPIGPGALLPPCTEAEVLSALEAAFGPAVPMKIGQAPDENAVRDSGDVQDSGEMKNRETVESAESAEDMTEENPDGVPPGSGPARYVSFPGFAGKIGFISPVSRPFCA
ncbi:MAG: radical SAM protein, partial [Oscillibacter sp.]|nr:radical SAM protein [Oscillibacter sp.]